MNNRNNIIDELREISPLIAGMEKVNVFTVPAGYFEGLAAGVLLRAKAHKQETGSAQMHGVPEGYFDSLADNILTKIKAQEAAEEYPFLNSISKENVYTVPQGYFESLAGNNLYNVKANEKTESFPVLSDISKENIYTVPQGYFDTISNAVLNRLGQPPQAKLVGMGKRTGWFKYAAAAVFTGTVILGIYKFTTNKPAAADLPGYYAAAKNTNVDEELAKVTDEDIIKYLQANGTDVDAAVVANVMDENELPSKEDYLTDDKALDKYLDNIDLTDLKN